MGLPYHFIAKHEAENGDIFIDPFNEGRLLSAAGGAELLTEISGGKEELQPEHLESVQQTNPGANSLEPSRALQSKRSSQSAGNNRTPIADQSGLYASHTPPRIAIGIGRRPNQSDRRA